MADISRTASSATIATASRLFRWANFLRWYIVLDRRARIGS